VLEDCLREDLNERAERRIAVLDPIKLVIDNYPEGREEECVAPNHPQKPELGRRTLLFGRELWIEREDFEETPPKGYFRLTPGAEVRLRYAFVVKCLGAERDAQGRVTVVHCTYDPTTKSGTPGADARKVRGNIHWLSARHAAASEVRQYDRLFAVPQPGRTAAISQAAPAHMQQAALSAAPATAAVALDDDTPFDEPTERNYLDDLNRHSRLLVNAFVEPTLTHAPAEARYQFERHGYFVADLRDHRPGRPAFNRAVTLRDSWGREAAPKR